MGSPSKQIQPQGARKGNAAGKVLLTFAAVDRRDRAVAQPRSRLMVLAPKTASEPNRQCRMHGGPPAGIPKGDQNAFEHGLYSTKTIAPSGVRLQRSFAR